jgi:hypothetical protein
MAVPRFGAVRPDFYPKRPWDEMGKKVLSGRIKTSDRINRMYRICFVFSVSLRNRKDKTGNHVNHFLSS